MKNLNQNIFSLIDKEKERQINGIEQNCVRKLYQK